MLNLSLCSFCFFPSDSVFSVFYFPTFLEFLTLLSSYFSPFCAARSYFTLILNLLLDLLFATHPFQNWLHFQSVPASYIHQAKHHLHHQPQSDMLQSSSLCISKFCFILLLGVFSFILPSLYPCFFYIHITEFPPFCVFPCMCGKIDVKRKLEALPLFSLNTSQPATGGKVKENLAVSCSGSRLSVVIQDEPSNTKPGQNT